MSSGYTGYNPPASQQTSTGGGGAGANVALTEDRTRAVEYTCGDCDAPVSLRRGEPIRCKNCGHRVLYKQRTNRMVQFEAR